VKTKEEIFAEQQRIQSATLHIHSIDAERPWGGFFVIDEADTDKFIQTYFPHLSAKELGISGKLSPKILIVAPGKKLSWQYHHRRAEIWKVIAGEAGVVTSNDDVERTQKILKTGDIIELRQGERHRLIGLDDWAVIAEIWRHTDENHPSDENDIVRVQDDFGR
jgi:mannose-6-phosphate isomerase